MDDEIDKIEKRIRDLESQSTAAEEKLWRDIVSANSQTEIPENDIEKNVEDYDREFTEKLKLIKPELYNDDAPEVDLYLLNEAGKIIVEEKQDQEDVCV